MEWFLFSSLIHFVVVRWQEREGGWWTGVHIADVWEAGPSQQEDVTPTPGPGVSEGWPQAGAGNTLRALLQVSEFWKIIQCAWHRTISQSGGKTKIRFDCFTLLQLSIRIVMKTQKMEKTWCWPLEKYQLNTAENYSLSPANTALQEKMRRRFACFPSSNLGQEP